MLETRQYLIIAVHHQVKQFNLIRHKIKIR